MKLLALLLISVTPVALHAQWLVGIKAGVARANLFDARTNDGAPYDYVWRTTPQAAFLVEAPLSDRLGLSFEAAYRNRGAREVSTIPAFKEYSSQLCFDYLDASVIATIRLSQEPVRPHFFVGGTYGAMVGARELFEENGSVTGGAVIDPVKLKLGRHCFGATAGAGFTVKAGQTSLVIEARYTHGFTDLFGEAALFDVNGTRIRTLDGYDRTVSAHLGWLIPLPKRAVPIDE